MDLTRIRSAAWVAMLTLLVSSGAWAQPRPGRGTTPQPESTVEGSSDGGAALEQLRQNEARTHLQTGAGHYQEGRYAEAIQSFQTAYRVFASPVILFNLAQAYRADGQLSLAISTFRRYLTENTRLTPQQRTDVEGVIQEIETTRAVLNFEVEPAGATIVLDGRTLGTSPLPRGVEVLPGTHRIEARLENHETVRDTIEIRAHDARLWESTLRPVAENAQLTLSVRPADAMLYLDGQEVGRGQLQRRVRPGEYTVRATLDGYIPEETQVTVGLLATQNVALTLRERPRSLVRRPLFWAVVGGVALIGALTVIALNPSVPDPLPGSPGIPAVQAISSW